MQWPDYFPENCPPDNAQAAFDQVYRLVDNDPPTPDDFQSWREQHPQEQCPKTVTECQACGLSVFTSISDIEVAQRKVRRLRNKKFVFEVKITRDRSPDSITIILCDRLDEDWLPMAGEFLELSAETNPLISVLT